MSFQLTVPATQRASGTVVSAPFVGRSRLEASRERVVAGQSPVRHGNLASPGHAELLPQDIRVGLRRAWGDTRRSPTSSFETPQR